MLTGVVALLLAIGAVVPSAGFGLVPSAALPQRFWALPVSVSMTTVNDGHAVSLLDPAHPAWVHPAPTGAVAEVTATVELHGSAVHQWVAHLDTPDSFLGVTPGDCRGFEEAPPRDVSCRFAVQAASGVVRLHFHFTADNGRVDIEADGAITGGQFDWDARWQVLDATGRWMSTDGTRSVVLPATVTSAVRYVVTNTGDVPFRVTNGCDDRLVPSGSRLVCPARGLRPGQSLARDYYEQLRLVDVVGATAEPDFRLSIRSVAGTSSGTPSPDAAVAAWPWVAVPLVLLVAVGAIVVLGRPRGGRLRRSSPAG